ncbi:WW domain-containing oxidoreductase [Mycena venus]|uniref:WW domain-containing oxidoreductase n=1 Tax=Mycena venus TaxID=2733690 RepID=A0A8H6YYS6_9AGAR|nr:WW domain-containing oxidoreductase [Mycena venus]
MRRTFWNFISDQWSKQQPVLKVDLTGKTVLVLGANTGLGFEATKHFATNNPARLILACRSQSKGQAALNKLKTATGYSKAELWIVDLAEFESVKQFADRFERDGGRLDILVENAAVAAPKYEATKDGWEASLEVNYLSTSLFALLLLPAMIKTAQQHSTIPRLVFVSSGAHYEVEIEKNVRENPDMTKTLGSSEYCTKKKMMSRYQLTKLLNLFFARALNDRLLRSTPLIIDAVSPGYCYSELRREFTGILAFIDSLMERLLALTTEEGSRHVVWAALARQEDPDVLRGQYISNCQIQEVSDFILAPEGVKAQDQLWDELVDILGKVDLRVTATVDEYLSSVVA